MVIAGVRAADEQTKHFETLANNSVRQSVAFTSTWGNAGMPRVQSRLRPTYATCAFEHIWAPQLPHRTHGRHCTRRTGHEMTRFGAPAARPGHRCRAEVARCEMTRDISRFFECIVPTMVY